MSTGMMNSTIPPFNFDASKTGGPMFLGGMFAIMLWGIEALQIVWYFVNYGEDPILLKLYTLILFAVGTAQVVGLFTLNYIVYVIHFGNVQFMDRVLPLGLANVSLVGATSFLAQMFFVFRIAKFAERPMFKYGVPLVLAPLIVYQFLGLQLYVGIGANLSSVPQAAKLEKFIVSAFGVQCAVDISIAVVMSVLLYLRRTGMSRSDRFISDLILASISTGACTAVLAASVIIIVQVTSAQQLTFATAFDMLPSMYVNSVLCNLNIRKFIRNHARDMNHGSRINLTSLRFRSKGLGKAKTSMPAFSVSRETHQDHSSVDGIGYESGVKTFKSSVVPGDESV